MPTVIDGRPVYDAYVQLNKNQISQDQFDTIFNPFSNSIDQMISNRGSNLGPNQRILKNFRDDLLTSIMSLLEGEEDNQTGKGLKILTPQRILTCLPIALAQL